MKRAIRLKKPRSSDEVIVELRAEIERLRANALEALYALAADGPLRQAAIDRLLSKK